VDWFGAFSIVIFFVLFLKLFKVVSSSKQVINLARTTLGVVKNKELTDLEKEKAMQRYSVELFKYFIMIALGCALALVIPLGFVSGLELLGLMSFDNVLAITLSWQFILATTLLGCLAYYLVVKKHG